MNPIPSHGDIAIYKRTTCAALRFDDWYQRWEGNLHFRAGTCRVYLAENPKREYVRQPEWFIKTVTGDNIIGMFYQRPTRKSLDGQINTERPIALMAYKTTGRDGNTHFVIHRIKASRTPSRLPIVLYLTPYPDGQKYEDKEWHVKGNQTREIVS